MKCKICGETDNAGVTFLNATSGQADYVCLLCQVKEQAKGMELEELNEQIESYEDLSVKYEELVKRVPPMDETPGFLQAMTPLSMYKSIQNSLAAFKSRRMEILANMDNETRLKYQLKQALESEDYKKASEIRKKLEA